MQDIEEYYSIAEYEIEQALELAELYLELYYELGEETIALMTQIVEDLESLAEFTYAVIENLDEIDQILETGGEVAAEVINQLQEQNQQAIVKLEEIRSENAVWMQTVKTELDLRAGEFLGIQPNNIASNRLEAITQAMDYLNGVKSSLGDGKISLDELLNISQLGASASLNAYGGPELGGLSGSINNMTAQIARGELPQVKAGLGELEGAIPRRP